MHSGKTSDQNYWLHCSHGKSQGLLRVAERADLFRNRLTGGEGGGQMVTLEDNGEWV